MILTGSSINSVFVIGVYFIISCTFVSNIRQNRNYVDIFTAVINLKNETTACVLSTILTQGLVINETTALVSSIILTQGLVIN